MKNRDKKTEPKLGQYWCYACDAALVSKGGKCPRCGMRDESKRRKK